MGVFMGMFTGTDDAAAQGPLRRLFGQRPATPRYTPQPPQQPQQPQQNFQQPPPFTPYANRPNAIVAPRPIPVPANNNPTARPINRFSESPISANSDRGGRLGVRIRNVDVDNGVEITYVAPNSAAAAAGIQIGDRIVSIERNVMTDTSRLIREISSYPPGKTVQIQFFRDQKPNTTNAVLSGDNRIVKASTQPTLAPTLKQPTPNQLTLPPATSGDRISNPTLGNSVLGNSVLQPPSTNTSKQDVDAKKTDEREIDELALDDDEPSNPLLE